MLFSAWLKSHVLLQCLLRVLVWKENHKALTEATGRRSAGEQGPRQSSSLPRFVVILQQHHPESKFLWGYPGTHSARGAVGPCCPSLLVSGSLPPRLMVCFVAFADAKVLAWSEQNHEGWPPTLCMWWFYIYIYKNICMRIGLLQV